MRLTIDLRSPRQPAAGGATDVEWLHASDLIAGVRRPAWLWRLLSRSYEQVRVVEGTLPATAYQGAALVLAALLRARTLEVHRAGAVSSWRRPAFVARALGVLARAAPAELWRSLHLLWRARRVAGTRFVLPQAPARPSSVLYVRTEPSVGWLGAFIGGAATHTLGIVNGLKANAIDVHVVSSEPPPGIPRDSVTTVPVRRLYHLVSWLGAVEHSRRLVEAASEHRADCVYQRHSIGSYAGLEMARRLDVPLILEFNGSVVWTSKTWWSHRPPLLGIAAALEERALRDASLVVVVSEVLRGQLIDRGLDAARVITVPNGVDVDALAPLRARSPSQWRCELGLEEAPTVGFIGTFGPWHGVTVLPEMIADIEQSRPNTRWVVVGDGTLHPRVAREVSERGLADKVLMTGALEHHEALRHLGACDVCVSPHLPNPDGSPFFGSPIKLFEYMGLEKPIVASDLNQIGEILDHGRTGLLCPPGDAGSAARAVTRLLDDKDLRQRLGAAALAEASEHHSWRARAASIIDALAAQETPVGPDADAE